MLKEKDECLCKRMLESGGGHLVGRVILHLYGCPKSYTTKDYLALPWYKKLFTGDPRKVYAEHKRQTGVY